MLINYFKTAWRSLRKNKLFAGINILGLAVGMASCLLLLSYVSFQYGFDNGNANKPHLYRVAMDYYDQGKMLLQSAETYAAVGPALKKDFPEVLNMARLYNMGYKNNCVFTVGDNAYREKMFLYADASYLSMFTVDFIQGDGATALLQPNTAVIAASTAQKLFPGKNAIGQYLQMNDDDRHNERCEITGVFKDLPENAHVRFNILFSYATLEVRKGGTAMYDNNWNRKDFYTYLQLKPGTNPQALAAKLPAFMQHYKPEENIHRSQSHLVLEHLSDVHFQTARIDEQGEAVNKKTLQFLSLIAIVIICIAWINYINVTIATSLIRSKEVGIRKVLGSSRGQLIRQFLTEAFTLNLMAFVLALMMIYALKPLLQSLFGYNFSLSILAETAMGAGVLLFLCVGSFLSGLYPALVLTGFRPVAVLKGKLKTSPKGMVLRKSLVTFQFALSIFLLIGMLVVTQQVNYMRHQNLGMNTAQVLVLDRPGKWDTARSTHNSLVNRFKDLLQNNATIESIGMADEIPGKAIRWPSEYKLPAGKGFDNPVSINTTTIDENYLSALGITLLAGRNFSKATANDDEGLIVSETAARELGFTNPAELAGKMIMQDGKPHPVVGVANDVHQLSLSQKVAPAVFQFNAGDAREFEYYFIKLKTNQIAGSIAAIKNSWNESFKDNPFDYYFLDAYFDSQYKADVRFGLLFSSFSAIAIVIACVGLFALLAFMIEQRTKEIGVRKVLGASFKDISLLLASDFMKLVLLANIIAWPLGAWLMNNWLKDFAYRIPINAWMFLTAGAMAFIIALLTISLQTIKASLSNPIKSLRTE